MGSLVPSLSLSRLRAVFGASWNWTNRPAYQIKIRHQFELGSFDVAHWDESRIGEAGAAGPGPISACPSAPPRSPPRCQPSQPSRRGSSAAAPVHATTGGAALEGGLSVILPL
jgi:hypothetical protein